ncbi:MAG TPA: carbamoyltransferase HypF [Candidatus Angelobacter sp.]|nr:carbamoyltransferase HypF [Candidatus Angelobacter sp.]
MNRRRARIVISGAVQGVGFRPFVYRLANELRLTGWVSNSAEGVLIEIEGPQSRLDEFISKIETDKPALAMVQDVKQSFLELAPYERFEIRDSEHQGARTALILPDIATCGECLRELFDPQNRRYLYPFTNCTHCGPRFSIIEALPYDRANTSMKQFAMCPECEREYHDPRDRRFHAQPNACPECGPRLELWDATGRRLCSEHEALLHAASAARAGRIVALKGIGGFQLIADGRNEEAIRQLRLLKRREEKPFAVMFPSLDAIQTCCCAGEMEKQLLLSAASPIVLMKKNSGEVRAIAHSVAPRNPWLGVMLPYSPLHHLLLRELGFPIVATSGNASDEPICTEELEALARLRGIADVFLVHNRPIVRHVDDSVVRTMGGREMIVRRARGYAPMPVQVSSSSPERGGQLETRNSKPETILAVGAHLKNAVALEFENQVFISQHIGDLETAHAFAAFQKSAADLPHLYGASPQVIAHDLHPEYLSTKFAQQLHSDRDELRPRIVAVQHHHAHILSCMADNELSGAALGVAWDGTGFGTDGTIWGGEFLHVNETGSERLAHLRQFCLPGGDAAIKQPRRIALGLLYEIFGAEVFHRNDLVTLRHFSLSELRMFERMLSEEINSPVTSSAGRFFDAVAGIVDLRQRVSFEGQAAMELEFAAAPGVEDAYSFELWKVEPIVIDWQSAIFGILDDLGRNQPVGIIAAKIHNTLAEIIVSIARIARETNVVLSGGCFQNQYLTERAIRRLRDEGFAPHWHRRIPPNDGGIALGQVMAVLRRPELGSEPDGQRREIAAEWSEPVLKP